MCYICSSSKHTFLKGIYSLSYFMKSIVRSSGGKTSKIWLNEGSIFRINLWQGPLKENVKEMYSTKNDGKSLFTE